MYLKETSGDTSLQYITGQLLLDAKKQQDCTAARRRERPTRSSGPTVCRHRHRRRPRHPRPGPRFFVLIPDAANATRKLDSRAMLHYVCGLVGGGVQLRRFAEGDMSPRCIGPRSHALTGRRRRPTDMGLDVTHIVHTQRALDPLEMGQRVSGSRNALSCEPMNIARGGARFRARCVPRFAPRVQTPRSVGPAQRGTATQLAWFGGVVVGSGRRESSRASVRGRDSHSLLGRSCRRHAGDPS